MSNFEGIKGDYQITAPIEKIDIARILRENLRDGSKNYVMIIANEAVMLLLVKKFANQLKRLKLIESIEIDENLEYGLFDKINTDSKAVAKGSMIRSIGFTHGLVFDICFYDDVLETLENVDHIEALIDNAKFDDNKKSGTIKVVAGK